MFLFVCLFYINRGKLNNLGKQMLAFDDEFRFGGAEWGLKEREESEMTVFLSGTVSG